MASSAAAAKASFVPVVEMSTKPVEALALTTSVWGKPTSCAAPTVHARSTGLPAKIGPEPAGPNAAGVVTATLAVAVTGVSSVLSASRV